MILSAHIDFSKHIFDIIDSVARHPSGSGGLPFRGLITWFMLHKGVKERASFAIKNPVEKINPISTRRSKGQLKRTEAPLHKEDGPSGVAPPVHEEGSPDIQQQEPERPVEEYTLQGLFELVKKMQEKQEAMFEELKQRQAVLCDGLQLPNRRYFKLERKVDQLFDSDSSLEVPPRTPTDEDIATALADIDTVIARQYGPCSQPAHPDPPQPTTPITTTADDTPIAHPPNSDVAPTSATITDPETVLANQPPDYETIPAPLSVDASPTSSEFDAPATSSVPQ